MKLIYTSGIATAVVVTLAVLIALTPFLSQNNKNLIVFTFTLNDNVTDGWCDELSSFLSDNNIKATVFLSGKIAEENTHCVKSFSRDVDIGTQTFSYTDWNSDNYSIQLTEVQKGKESVDRIGNLITKSFKAPYGKTDDNIYSILSRSNIVADFSYTTQFNKWENNQFVKYDSVLISAADLTPQSVKDQISAKSEVPVFLDFSNDIPLSDIKNIILNLNSSSMTFVNVSELTGLDLTESK